MQPQPQDSPLKTQIPPLSPDSLLKLLHASPNLSLDHLLSHFHCSLDDLASTLNNPEFLTRHKVQTQLAFLQSRLIAHRFLGNALAKTITLMNESEKPEVARRAASALIQIAGLPIRTSPQPAPTPLPDPPAPTPPTDSSDDPDPLYSKDVLSSLDFMLHLKRSDGIDLAAVDPSLRPTLTDHLRSFFSQHHLPQSDGYSS